METLYHREYLPQYTFSTDSYPGFVQHPINRLAFQRPPATSLSLETNRIKRDMSRTTKNIVPLLEYQLWLEAGKLDKLNFKNEKADPDVVFNSNLWRNFRSSSGLIDTNKKNNVIETVSSLYPINIPSPSQVGANTLSNFYEQNRYNMFKDDKTYNLTVARVEHEATFMKFLRLKSELRNPPLDFDGNIIPPKNFQTYPPLPKNPYHREKSNLSDNDYVYRRAKGRAVQAPTSSAATKKELVASSQIDFKSLEKATNRRFTAKSKVTATDNQPEFVKWKPKNNEKKKYSSSARALKTNNEFSF